MSFLSIQLLNELLYPFHLTYNLLPFSCINFPILNYFWFFLIWKNSSDQLEHSLLQKCFIYFDTLRLLPSLNLGSLLLISLLESIYLFDLTSTCFILVVLRYVLLYLLIVSSNLSICTYFETEVMYVFINFIF